jgi:hypothetical protein
MSKESVSINELGQMIRQVITSEQKEPYAYQRYPDLDPPFPLSEGHRMPWGDDFVFYDLRMEMGITGCMICGATLNMGDLFLAGSGVEVSLPIQKVHVIEAHGGYEKGKPVADFKNLQVLFGVDHLPLTGEINARLQQVLLALSDIQWVVPMYKADEHRERANAVLSEWGGRQFELWYPSRKRKPPACPLCDQPYWKSPAIYYRDISLSTGGVVVHVPAQARHLMELHGLTDYEGWPAWDTPGGYDTLCEFLGIE